MKRFILLFIIFLASATHLFAQEANAVTNPTATTTEQIVSMPKTDWLTPFHSIKINGPMNVVLKSVNNTEDIRIIHDTKGNITSKFKFEVDKNGVLTISEKNDPKRTSVTDITLYYNSLREVKVAHATAQFEDCIKGDMFDISVSGGATVSLNAEVFDLAVECTGTSRLTIGGSTKYLTMRVSTAKVNCSELSTVSTIVDTSHSAEVRIMVSERLEVTTSTGAKLFYKGHPKILRDHSLVFGGEIVNNN